MGRIFARKALIQKDWIDNVGLEIRSGRIAAVAENADPEAADVIAGIVIPGLANAHSHAFQRALAGRTEQRSPQGKDNFWTWRDRMYSLAGRLDADAMTAIARQAFTEMLESGYTGVAEFHYLHNPADHPDAASVMFTSLADAARDSGIRLSYVPVLYERAGFDAAELQPEQALFALDINAFLEHQALAAESATRALNVGIGVHSLRAVTPGSLARVVEAAGNGQCPLHLHVAEQQREVEQCLAAYGQRPVRWLLDNHRVDESWCLVHATHIDTGETRELAATGAVVCLCPSTEGNLGDGLFPLRDFLAAGGRIAIGSDSHVSINPFEELRWLEYGQRLASQSRNIAAIDDPHVGRELFGRVLRGGQQACGMRADGLAIGAAADLVVLDDGDPMLVSHGDETLLDALVFSGYRLPIERVMVDGRWCVVDGVHVDRDNARRAYAAALQRVGIAP